MRFEEINSGDHVQILSSANTNIIPNVKLAERYTDNLLATVHRYAVVRKATVLNRPQVLVRISTNTCLWFDPVNLVAAENQAVLDSSDSGDSAQTQRFVGEAVRVADDTPCVINYIGYNGLAHVLVPLKSLESATPEGWPLQRHEVQEMLSAEPSKIGIGDLIKPKHVGGAAADTDSNTTLVVLDVIRTEETVLLTVGKYSTSKPVAVETGLCPASYYIKVRSAADYVDRTPQEALADTQDMLKKLLTSLKNERELRKSWAEYTDGKGQGSLVQTKEAISATDALVTEISQKLGLEEPEVEDVYWSSDLPRWNLHRGHSIIGKIKMVVTPKEGYQMWSAWFLDGNEYKQHPKNMITMVEAMRVVESELKLGICKIRYK